MDILSEVIGLMSKEEVRMFKLLSQRVDSSKVRKDLDLFDYIKKKGEEYREEDAFKKFYIEEERNAFHRLKSRLVKKIQHSLTFQYLDNSEYLNTFQQLFLFDHFLSKNHFELSERFLRKAERIAEKNNYLEALDIIYNEYIRLSRHLINIDPSTYIQKRKKNREKLNQLRDIDDVLAAVSYKIRISQNFGPEASSSLNELQSIVEGYISKLDLRDDPMLKIKLYESIVSILLQKRDYQTLQEYLLKTHAEFNASGIYNRKTHDLKLRTKTFLANALFKNGNFNESLKYAEMLREAMDEYDGFLRDKYLFYYYNILVINYFEKDIDKVIDILLQMKQNEIILRVPFNLLFIHLNLANAYSRKKQYSTAIKYIIQLYMLDSYKTADKAFQLKMQLAELIIRFRLQEYEVLETRIRQLRTEFREMLRQPAYMKEKEFISLMNRLKSHPAITTNQYCVRKVKLFLQKYQDTRDDSEIISYTTFLKEISEGKLNNKKGRPKKRRSKESAV